MHPSRRPLYLLVIIVSGLVLLPVLSKQAISVTKDNAKPNAPSDTTMRSLLARIEALESQLQAASPTPLAAPKKNDTVRTKKLEIVDDSGRLLGVFGSTTQGVVLSLIDPDAGTIVITSGSKATGPIIDMVDSSKSLECFIGFDTSQGQAMLIGKTRNYSSMVAARLEGGSIAVTAEKSKQSSSINCVAGRGAGARFSNSTGAVKLNQSDD